MTKAVFVDYMGTTVDEHSQEMGEIVRRICKNSAVHDPKQVQRFSLDNRRRYEADSYLDSYLTEDEIVDRLIADMEAQLGLADDPAFLLPDTTRSSTIEFHALQPGHCPIHFADSYPHS